MKRFSITIASILFFLVSVSGVHGASFEISGGTESNLTTDTAQVITGDKTFGDNVKLYFGTGQDANVVFDGTNLFFSGPSSNTAQFGKGANEVTIGDGTSTFSPAIKLSTDNLYFFATTGTNDAVIRVFANEKFIWQDSNASVGLVIDPTNELIAGTTASGGDLALVGSTHNTKGDVVIHSTSYFRFDKTSAGAPDSGDCDDDGDRGRLVIDTTNDRLYVCNGGTRAWDVVTLTDSADLRPTAIGFIIDGGGAEITTGEKGHIEVPYACTISRVTMLADQSGDIEVDIWKDTFGNFPPTSGDSITASTVATISGDVAHQDTTLTSWTTSVTAGDILAYNVDTVKTLTRVTVSLKCDRD